MIPQATLSCIFKAGWVRNTRLENNQRGPLKSNLHNQERIDENLLIVT